MKRTITLAVILWAAALQAQTQSPILPENAVTRVTDHVYGIMAWPNVAIVVGNRATLVVDTGMGPRNGALVAREAQKLSANKVLYLTTTHFHPEHASGAQAFPAHTILIRPAAQHEEMNRRDKQFLDMFRGRSPLNKELLADVRQRTPDMLFDREMKLDLGGLTARLLAYGPAHTRGDEMVFVVEDSVLISGDIVQNQLVPNTPNEDGSVKSWLAILDQIEPLKPRKIFPDHGELGDASLIASQRAFLFDVQGRALAQRNKGVPVDDAAKILTAELKEKYPTWTNINAVANLTRRVYGEAGPAASPDRGKEFFLWPNGAPGSENVTTPEVSKPSTNPKYLGWPANYTVTHKPALYLFPAPKDKATGAAVIVAPGGGHRQLVIEKEGWEIADWLNAQGITAIVLKYRLAKAEGSKYTLPEHVYADAARAVRFVRSHAREWNIDPHRIGFSGFSAGGEVAGMIETRFDAGNPNASDPIERVSSRPDFNVLVYPWYRPGANQQASAPLFPVPKDAPPVFMVCTDDDRSHVEPTVKFYLELEEKQIPTEMHIYTYGGHGFALRPTRKPSPVMGWPERLKEWLAERDLSK